MGRMSERPVVSSFLKERDALMAAKFAAAGK
jgi:hypothetical protein